MLKVGGSMAHHPLQTLTDFIEDQTGRGAGEVGVGELGVERDKQKPHTQLGI